MKKEQLIQANQLTAEIKDLEETLKVINNTKEFRYVTLSTETNDGYRGEIRLNQEFMPLKNDLIMTVYKLALEETIKKKQAELEAL